MQKEISIKLLPEQIQDEALLRSLLAQQCKVNVKDVSGYKILRRSIDARGRTVHYVLRCLVYIKENPSQESLFRIQFNNVSNANKSVIIIGAGPAGLFAALRLIELNIKPIIIERGKDVRARRRDLAAMNKQGIVNPDSNYCFGEGGAGTYSDGKLYTRSNKRGNIDRILNIFVHFGAPDNITYDAHPHIGTNKLPHIITAMREVILEAGGEVLFDTKLLDIVINNDQIHQIQTNKGILKADAYLLATGHSARDIFSLLNKHRLQLEAKPFALGVRVEHPQVIINNAQYHCSTKPEGLPPASYSLVQQINERGMFSFCMCPGGIIAPAATAPGEIVVNGWSPSKRNNPFANSGIVVEIGIKDALPFLKDKKITPNDPLLLMHFQQMVEQRCFVAGGGNLVAPAQRMTDFCNNKISTSLPDNSYLPGLKSSNLSEVLPNFVYDVLRKGFPLFGKKIKGYYTDEAIVVATESRTSSPVKIPRDPIALHHPQLSNLYPCGEGAGYAGGIVSAAMDGEKVANIIHETLIHP